MWIFAIAALKEVFLLGHRTLSGSLMGILNK